MGHAAKVGPCPFVHWGEQHAYLECLTAASLAFCRNMYYIPVEDWKCLGEIALEFLTKLYNRTMESERMPEEWRDSILIPIFNNKGDVHSCSNYRGIKLISHIMELWERVVERRLRSELTFSEQQYGFMPGKSTTDALFALRVLMEK